MTGRMEVAAAAGLSFWLAAGSGSTKTLTAELLPATGEETVMSAPAPSRGPESIRPFHFHAPDEALSDLKRRISAMRWPEKETVTDTRQGVQLATMQALARYWATQYDWRKCEAKLSAWEQPALLVSDLRAAFKSLR